MSPIGWIDCTRRLLEGKAGMYTEEEEEEEEEVSLVTCFRKSTARVPGRSR